MEAQTVPSNGAAQYIPPQPEAPQAAAPQQPTTPAQGVVLSQEDYAKLMAAQSKPGINLFNPQAAAKVASATGEIAGTVVQSGVVVVTGFLGGFFQGLSKK